MLQGGAFLFSRKHPNGLWVTQPPTQLVLAAAYPGVLQLGRESNHTPPNAYMACTEASGQGVRYIELLVHFICTGKETEKDRQCTYNVTL